MSLGLDAGPGSDRFFVLWKGKGDTGDTNQDPFTQRNRVNDLFTQETWENGMTKLKTHVNKPQTETRTKR